MQSKVLRVPDEYMQIYSEVKRIKEEAIWTREECEDSMIEDIMSEYVDRCDDEENLKKAFPMLYAVTQQAVRTRYQQRKRERGRSGNNKALSY